MSRFLILVNPSSHGGRSARRLPQLKRLLPDGEFVVLENIEEARRKAREAEGFESIVACGGDGTVNAVAGGVLENPDPSLKFGALYTGTSPDFCREHGIPLDPARALETLRTGEVREIPVLAANGVPFLCSINLGMGAAVAASANALRPRLGDFAGTLWPVVRETLHSRRYDIAADDEMLCGIIHALVTRMPRIAGGMRLALPPLAEDEYALWMVRNVSRAGALALIWKLFRGKSCGEFRILRGRTEFSSAAPVAVEYDGDPHGALPVAVDFYPRRLKLIAPPQGEN